MLLYRYKYNTFCMYVQKQKLYDLVNKFPDSLTFLDEDCHECSIKNECTKILV